MIDTRIESLSSLITKRDYKLYHQAKEITNKYRMLFGDYQLDLMIQSILQNRLAQKVHLLSEAISKNLEVNLIEIEEELDDFFEEDLKDLEIEEVKVKKAKNYTFLDPNEACSLNNIYKNLVKRLSSEIYDDENVDRQRLWSNVKIAYANKDFFKLERLELEADYLLCFENYRTRKDLDKQIEKQENYLNALKFKLPFSLEQFYLDTKIYNLHLKEAKEELQSVKKSICDLEAKVIDLMMLI